MKKSLIALFVAAFCFSSMAQVLVYDFSASFKRLDVKLVKYNYTFPEVKADEEKGIEARAAVTVKNAMMDSAKVVSDKFTGYMVIDACENCDGAMTESAADEGNTAVFYIVRGGDKAKNIYRAVSTFTAAMFGSKTFQNPDFGMVNETKFTDALGDFEIPLTWDADDDNNGYLGFDNYSDADEEDGNTLYGQGYGKVAKQSTTVVNKTTDCNGDHVSTVTTTCWMVKNLSGSVVGDTNYAGECGEFIFDVCSLEDVHDAVLPGTFTLKLNNSLTFNKKAFRYTTFAEAETAILAKLKYAADDVIYIPEDGDGSDLSLIDGEVWTKTAADGE